jgi:hypothetical protein
MCPHLSYLAKEAEVLWLSEVKDNWSLKRRHHLLFWHELWKYIASLNTWAYSVPVQNSMEELAVVLLHIQWVPGYCPSLEVFCDFIQLIEANANIVPQIRWQTVLSTSFTIYYLQIIMPVNTT